MSEVAGNQVVIFGLGNDRFAVDVGQVREVLRTPPLTRLPGAPEYVRGVANLRGEVVPVVDLRVKLGEPEGDHDDTRVVVCELDGEAIGIEVDEVQEVATLDPEQIHPAPRQWAEQAQQAVTGIARLEEELILLVDLGRLLKSDLDLSLEALRQAREEAAGADEGTSEREREG